jgi:6-phosphogluconolactonase
MKIKVFPSPSAVAEAAARHFVAASAAAIAARGQFTVALSGGSTPEALHRRLAEPDYAAQVNWPRVHVFFGDERAVPPDDARSNYGKARETLLTRVPLPPENLHPMAGGLLPNEGAAQYERALAEHFGADNLPRFDLILLGMGDDGHTASLFPGMPALDERARWVVATDVPPYVQPNVSRITLTYPVLNAARVALFLVTGNGKAARLGEVLSGDSALPAARVNPADGELIWLLDEEAASQLKR